MIVFFYLFETNLFVIVVFFLSFSFYHGYEGYGFNERWLVYSGSFYFPCVSVKKECMVIS